jgi:hypothetical protein
MQRRNEIAGNFGNFNYGGGPTTYLSAYPTTTSHRSSIRGPYGQQQFLTQSILPTSGNLTTSYFMGGPQPTNTDLDYSNDTVDYGDWTQSRLPSNFNPDMRHSTMVPLEFQSMMQSPTRPRNTTSSRLTQIKEKYREEEELQFSSDTRKETIQSSNLSMMNSCFGDFFDSDSDSAESDERRDTLKSARIEMQDDGQQPEEVDSEEENDVVELQHLQVGNTPRAESSKANWMIRSFIPKPALNAHDPHKSFIKQASMLQSIMFLGEPDQYNSLIKTLKRTQKLYTDPDFPPTFSSLSKFGNEAQTHLEKKLWNKLIWARAPEMFKTKDFTIFNEEISPNDINQGS